MKKSKRETQTEQEAKAVARMLRVSPQKLNLIAQMVRNERTVSGPTTQLSNKVAGRGKNAIRKQIESLVSDYKKAGYDISGATNDGVVIVSPSGKPDSFNLKQLDTAFSAVNIKN